MFHNGAIYPSVETNDISTTWEWLTKLEAVKIRTTEMASTMIKHEHFDEFVSSDDFDLIEFYLSSLFARTSNMQQNLGKL